MEGAWPSVAAMLRMLQPHRSRLVVWFGLLASLIGVACTTEDTDAAGHAGNAGRTGSGGGSSSGGSASGGSADPGYTTGGWTTGLTIGPNGPIPLVVVDQFGYRTDQPKLALMRDPRTGYDADVDFTPGATYAVVDAATDETVFEGTSNAWNGGAEDGKSGDALWSFDFSDLTTPGTYYVLDVEHAQRSPDFDVRDDVYTSVLRHALRTFFYQRAGFAKTAETAGADWADGASHLKPGQDAEARDFTDRTNLAKVRDLRGGWYDAGDYNKYTSWHARYVITLLRAFVYHPNAFGDDFGIAESGNGVPDLLDEVKFGLDWLERMQNDDGSVLCIQGLADGSPPSSAVAPSYYGPATTSATLASAAAFAYAARVFASRPEPELAALADVYVGRAERAWEYASANPSVTYYNNNETRQPGSRGLGSGQQETNESGRLAWKVEAASYLFERTGKDAYRDFFDQNYTAAVPNGLVHWDIERHEAVLDYATQAGATASVADAIRSQFVQRLNAGGGPLAAAAMQQDAYRAGIQTYTWGSNQSKCAAARLLLLATDYALDPASNAAARAAAADYLHYLHGVNPLGLVYLSNMRSAGAEYSVSTFYHSWFSHKSARWSQVTANMPGPAPGFLVGGPNPSFALDKCCTDGSGCSGAAEFRFCEENWSPPLAQPHEKSYRQSNESWPANSWAVTENSNGYQAQYVRVLAAFAE